MLVTYRLNPAFSVTNLSSSSTSGWRNKQNKQSSECNNSGRSATAIRILCFSQFPVNKGFTCWEAPPSQILLTFTHSLVSGSQRNHSALVNLMPESPCSPKQKSVPEGRITKTASLCPGLSDLLYYGLPQRAARSWLECQWCLLHPESAGHLEPAPGCAGPCTSPESTSSSVSPQWWAVQVWKQPRTESDSLTICTITPEGHTLLLSLLLRPPCRLVSLTPQSRNEKDTSKWYWRCDHSFQELDVITSRENSNCSFCMC